MNEIIQIQILYFLTEDYIYDIFRYFGYLRIHFDQIVSVCGMGEVHLFTLW